MQQITQDKIEYLILQVAIEHFENLSHKSLSTEAILTSIQTDLQQNHSEVLSHFQQNLVKEILKVAFEFLLSKFTFSDKNFKQNTFVKQEFQEIITLNETHFQASQQSDQIYKKSKIDQDSLAEPNIFFPQNIEPKHSPKKASTTFIKRLKNLPSMMVSENPIYDYRREKKMVQTQLKFVRMSGNQQKVKLQQPQILQKHPKMIQTKLDFGKNNLKPAKKEAEWPIFSLSKKYLYSKSQNSFQTSIEKNQVLKNKLLKLINKEFQVSKDLLIEKKLQNSEKYDSGQKITAFLTYQPKVAGVKVQHIKKLQQPKNAQEIKIGNAKFMYDFEGGDIKFKNVTFFDKTIQMRSECLLRLLNQRFVSQVIGLPPKDRKRSYSNLISLHKMSS